MAKVKKIDSNVSSLSYAEEISYGVVDGSVTWNPLEPNGYSHSHKLLPPVIYLHP